MPYQTRKTAHGVYVHHEGRCVGVLHPEVPTGTVTISTEAYKVVRRGDAVVAFVLASHYPDALGALDAV